MCIQLNLSYYAGIMFNAFKDLLCSSPWINSSLALCRMTRLKSYEILVNPCMVKLQNIQISNFVYNFWELVTPSCTSINRTLHFHNGKYLT